MPGLFPPGDPIEVVLKVEHIEEEGHACAQAQSDRLRHVVVIKKRSSHLEHGHEEKNSRHQVNKDFDSKEPDTCISIVRANGGEVEDVDDNLRNYSENHQQERTCTLIDLLDKACLSEAPNPIKQSQREHAE